MALKTESPKRGSVGEAPPQAEGRTTLWGGAGAKLEAWRGAIGRSPRSGVYFILGALLIFLGFLLYIQFSLIGRIRTEARAAIKQHAFFYKLAVTNSIEDPKDFAFIFETLTNPRFQLIVTDERGEALQNSLFPYGTTTEAQEQYLKRMVPEMDSHNEPIEIEVPVTALLREDDFQDLSRLAAKLREPRDPISLLLRQRLSPYTQFLLVAPGDSGPDPGLLRYALIDDLNRLIKGDLLYDRQRFDQVLLSEKTRALLRKDTRGEDLIRLNRMLLEDVYPQEIARRETPPGGKWRIFVHYGDSDLIRHLSYFPFVALGVIALFVAVSYLGYRNIKNSEQRSIWVGMAKETAHQLGTPLMSLEGWLELLKADATEAGGAGASPGARRLERAVAEMARDLGRINKVVSRFSQIGSVPELRPGDLNGVVGETAAYLRARVPRVGGEIRITEDYGRINEVPLNRELIGWAFENLFKNAVDALEGREGTIRVVTRRWDEQFLEALVCDNGRGIDPRHQKRIFEPGYTTKKRGWGLGLTLVKRIVEDYHGGRVTILETAPGLGTTFQVLLPIKQS